MGTAQKTKKLIIFGLGDLAALAYEYFTHDSPYEVVAFTVEAEYATAEEFMSLPVVPLEKLQETYIPKDFHFFAALVYGELNRLRERVYQNLKKLGYTPASYISSRAFVWPNVTLGEHCFIFEDNTVQPFVSIGNNVVLWSGNHIGHHSTIEDHCFVSSHVVVSGHCRIGRNSFIGVNATLGNDVALGPYSWMSPGTMVTKSIPEKSLVKGAPSEVLPLDEAALLRALSRLKRSA